MTDLPVEAKEAKAGEITGNYGWWLAESMECVKKCRINGFPHAKKENAYQPISYNRTVKKQDYLKDRQHGKLESVAFRFHIKILAINPHHCTILPYRCRD
jgi:hypothetical protein